MASSPDPGPDGVVRRHVRCSLCGADEPVPVLVDTVDRAGTAFRFPVVRCARCGFVYVTPRLVGAVLGNTSGGGAWRSAALVNRGIYDGGLRRLLRSGLKPGDRLLDVGSGYGDFVAFARAAGVDAAGVELNADLASAARSRGIDVRTGDLRTILDGEGGWPAASFDAVTLWDVIEHVDEPIGLLGACRDALRPGGLLLLHTGNARFQIPKARLLLALRPRGGPYLASHQHISHFDPGTAGRALSSAGLEPLSAFHAGTLRYGHAGKRLVMRATNGLLALPSRLGGPLLTSAMAVVGRRPA